MTARHRKIAIRVACGAACVLMIALAKADEPQGIACPGTIVPPRPDVSAPAGWEAYWSGRPEERLRGIDVVHGGDRPPLAFLVPSVRKEDQRIIGTWDLRSYTDDPEPIWLYCQYENTALRLTHPLPHAVHFCRSIATDNGAGTPGFPVTAECR